MILDLQQNATVWHCQGRSSFGLCKEHQIRMQEIQQQ